MKLFLGGTCNGSDWREKLIPLLKCRYFNPVLSDDIEWTEEHQKLERHERDSACDFSLFTLTSDMKGVFSVAEVVDCVHRRNERVILCILKDGFDEDQVKSLEAVADIIREKKGFVFYSLEDTAEFVNGGYIDKGIATDLFEATQVFFAPVLTDRLKNSGNPVTAAIVNELTAKKGVEKVDESKWPLSLTLHFNDGEGRAAIKEVLESLQKSCNQGAFSYIMVGDQNSNAPDKYDPKKYKDVHSRWLDGDGGITFKLSENN